MQLGAGFHPRVGQQGERGRVLRVVLGGPGLGIGQAQFIALVAHHPEVEAFAQRALDAEALAEVQVALGAVHGQQAGPRRGHVHAVLVVAIDEDPAQGRALAGHRAHVDHPATARQLDEAPGLQAGQQQVAVALGHHPLRIVVRPGPQPQRAGRDEAHHRQHQHHHRAQQAPRAHARGHQHRHLGVAVQPAHRQQQAQHQAQRQDQRQVVQHHQAELGQHQAGRDPPPRDVAEDVGEHAAEAHDHQDHQGREGGLGEFAEEVAVELRHPGAALH